jgi:site-specific DNA-cytosine methylase
MKVLSLFDGISCGQLALVRAGVQYESYTASEVDQHAISVTQKNFPRTSQLGDVRSIQASPGQFDLLLGGSPCQGFSFAGKQLNFSDPRSSLFFEFVRVFREASPKWFLLENVRMKSEFSKIISEHLGVQPLEINSSLVSAQNRNRLYWTNIPVASIPADKGLVLLDILEDKGSWSDQTHREADSNRVKILRNIYPSGGQNGAVHSVFGKSRTLCAGTGVRGNGVGSSNAPKIDFNNEKGWRRLTTVECERLQTIPDGYTSIVCDTQRYKMLGNCWTVDVVAHILKGLVF